MKCPYCGMGPLLKMETHQQYYCKNFPSPSSAPKRESCGSRLPPFPADVRIYGEPNMMVNVPARRHRKKRIAKKWLKKYGVKYLPSTKVLYMPHIKAVACRPTTAELIREYYMLRQKEE